MVHALPEVSMLPSTLIHRDHGRCQPALGEVQSLAETHKAAPTRSAGAARCLLVAGAVKDIVRRTLCLGRRVNQELAIIAKSL